MLMLFRVFPWIPWFPGLRVTAIFKVLVNKVNLGFHRSFISKQHEWLWCHNEHEHSEFRKSTPALCLHGDGTFKKMSQSQNPLTECSRLSWGAYVGLALPRFWAVAAGPGRWRVGVAGPGAVGAQVLHVPREQREECGLRVSRRLSALALQQSHQEVDVAHGQPQDLVLAELFLRRVRGNEFPQLREGCVDIMLAPALACVGENLPGHDAAVFLQKETKKQTVMPLSEYYTFGKNVCNSVTNKRYLTTFRCPEALWTLGHQEQIFWREKSKNSPDGRWKQQYLGKIKRCQVISPHPSSHSHWTLEQTPQDRKQGEGERGCEGGVGFGLCLSFL